MSNLLYSEKKCTDCDGGHLSDVIFKCIYTEFLKWMNILT